MRLPAFRNGHADPIFPRRLGRFSRKLLETLGFAGKMRIRHTEPTEPSGKYRAYVVLFHQCERNSEKSYFHTISPAVPQAGTSYDECLALVSLCERTDTGTCGGLKS